MTAMSVCCVCLFKVDGTYARSRGVENGKYLHVKIFMLCNYRFVTLASEIKMKSCNFGGPKSTSRPRAYTHLWWGGVGGMRM